MTEHAQDPRRAVVAWLGSENIVAEIKRALPDHVPVDWFMRLAQTAILMNQDLASADRPSLLRELVAVAQLGLVLDPQMGEAWLIVDSKSKVQRRVGYQGLRKLALQSGLVTGLNSQAVYAHDQTDIELGDAPHVRHKIDVTAEERGKILGCYAVGRVTGTDQPVVEWMSWKQIQAHRDRYSQAKSGPWSDPLAEVEMARKTVFRRLCKWLPKSPLLADALAEEDRIDMRTINPDAELEPEPQPRRSALSVIAAANAPRAKAIRERALKVALDRLADDEEVIDRGPIPQTAPGRPVQEPSEAAAATAPQAPSQEEEFERALRLHEQAAMVDAIREKASHIPQTAPGRPVQPQDAGYSAEPSEAAAASALAAREAMQGRQQALSPEPHQDVGYSEPPSGTPTGAQSASKFEAWIEGVLYRVPEQAADALIMLIKNSSSPGRVLDDYAAQFDALDNKLANRVLAAQAARNNAQARKDDGDLQAIEDIQAIQRQQNAPKRGRPVGSKNRPKERPPEPAGEARSQEPAATPAPGRAEEWQAQAEAALSDEANRQAAQRKAGSAEAHDPVTGEIQGGDVPPWVTEEPAPASGDYELRDALGKPIDTKGVPVPAGSCLMTAGDFLGLLQFYVDNSPENASRLRIHNQREVARLIKTERDNALAEQALRLQP